MLHRAEFGTIQAVLVLAIEKPGLFTRLCRVAKCRKLDKIERVITFHSDPLWRLGLGSRHGDRRILPFFTSSAGHLLLSGCLTFTLLRGCGLRPALANRLVGSLRRGYVRRTVFLSDFANRRSRAFRRHRLVGGLGVRQLCRRHFGDN
ncbi:MAG: hypothetical protein CM15mP115_24830 [Alphaproteobacteria bacterium]|nr:MAG: hypothetical protein CM15mP115_24830 [Alphaproteobacteria bacterium]